MEEHKGVQVALFILYPIHLTQTCVDGFLFEINKIDFGLNKV
jgi:hypothetical protein